MTLPRILIQLDSDGHPSVFDAVVAIDAGVEHLLQYASIDASNVVPLVHGAMFTRGPKDLAHTAIFVGGSDVSAGEAIVKKIASTFFGPIRVSVMMDGNGANTTAAAAVLAAARHVELGGARALVLGGSGPVGGRVARLLAREGCHVALASRRMERAENACTVLRQTVGPEHPAPTPIDASSADGLNEELARSTALFACGAAGVQLLDATQLERATELRVAIDLNAVPPAGLAGIGATDKATLRGQRSDYGAIGVGGLKMKIHRASIQALFASNDQSLDAEEIFAIGQQLEGAVSQ